MCLLCLPVLVVRCGTPTTSTAPTTWRLTHRHKTRQGKEMSIRGLYVWVVCCDGEVRPFFCWRITRCIRCFSIQCNPYLHSIYLYSPFYLSNIYTKYLRAGGCWVRWEGRRLGRHAHSPSTLPIHPLCLYIYINLFINTHLKS